MAYPNIVDTAHNILGYQMRRVTGHEYCGPTCPNCGDGNDRFHVWLEPGKQRYWCRKCGIKGRHYDFLIQFCGMNHPEAYQYLGRKGQRKKYIKHTPAGLLKAPIEMTDNRLPRKYLAYRLNIEPDDVIMPTTKTIGILELGYYEPSEGGGRSELVGHFPCAIFQTRNYLSHNHALRIYLATDGQGKADLGGRDPKKLAKGRRPIGDAVLWGDPEQAEKMLLCEGVETGQALAQSFKDEVTNNKIVVAAALSTAGIKNFIPWPTTKLITVGADRDEKNLKVDLGLRTGCMAGLEAAEAFSQKNAGGPDISIAIPGKPGTKVDWLDVWVAEGPGAVRKGIEGTKNWPKPKTNKADLEFLPPQAQGIPHNFMVDSSNVWVMEENRDGETNWVWVCSKLIVEALTRSSESQAWGRLLIVKDPDGIEHQWPMPAEMLAGNGEEYRRVLHDLGLDISPSPKARKALHDYLSLSRPKKRIRCVNKVGWHGSVFVFPDGAIGAEDEYSVEPVIFQTPGIAPNIYKVAGELACWQDLARLCIGNSRLVLVVSAAFAGPLLYHIRAEGGGINLRGGSSIGKSTALYLSASVWGCMGVVRSWRTTSNGLESTALAANDALLCLDELSQATAGDAGEVAYMITNGQGKTRMKRDTSPRPVASWRVLFLSTGEISLADKIQESGARARAGQDIRVLDVPADAGAGMGIFETLHFFKTPVEFVNHIRQQTALHYGHPARTFLKRLTTDLPGLPDALNRERTQFVDKFCPAGADGQVIRAAERFGIIAAGGTMATAVGVLPWPENEALNAAHRCFGDWLADRGTIGSQEINVGLGQVRKFFQLHGESRFQLWNCDKEKPVNNRAGFIRDGNYLVFPEIFKGEVCAGLDSKQIVQALLAEDLLVPDPNGKPSTVHYYKGRARRFYFIKGDIVGSRAA